MQLVKQNEKVVNSRQGRGLSVVIRETEYAMLSEPDANVLGYLTQYVVGQDLPERKDLKVCVNYSHATKCLNDMWNHGMSQIDKELRPWPWPFVKK